MATKESPQSLKHQAVLAKLDEFIANHPEIERKMCQGCYHIIGTDGSPREHIAADCKGIGLNIGYGKKPKTFEMPNSGCLLVENKLSG